jgi:YVTN family beta-propeller protein
MDTVLNKLYFVTGARAIGVADCSRHVVTTYMWQCDLPEWMAANPNGNKLYCSSRGDGSVVVFDGTADTAIKSIYVGEHVRSLVMYPERNKLYAFTEEHIPGHYTIAVIDCNADTVAGTIVLPAYSPDWLFLVPESDRLWSLHDFGFTIIDTRVDSIVADTVTVNWGNLLDACVDMEERKVYRAGRLCLYWIDMDSIAHIDSMVRGSVKQEQNLLCVESQHKLYWTDGIDVGDPDSVYVVDTRSDSVVSKLLGAATTSGMCLDRTGNYVYCSGATDSFFCTIDTRTDSVVNRTRVPRNLQGFVCNQRRHRIYAWAWDAASHIPVIYDSAGAGLYEAEAEPVCGPPCATLVSRTKPLWDAATATLYDASGRRVAALQPGFNDIGHVVPGVYFLCEEPQATSHKPQAVRKLVIAR